MLAAVVMRRGTVAPTTAVVGNHRTLLLYGVISRYGLRHDQRQQPRESDDDDSHPRFLAFADLKKRQDQDHPVSKAEGMSWRVSVLHDATYRAYIGTLRLMLIAILQVSNISSNDTTLSSLDGLHSGKAEEMSRRIAAVYMTQTDRAWMGTAFLIAAPQIRGPSLQHELHRHHVSHGNLIHAKVLTAHGGVSVHVPVASKHANERPR